jgi:two-component sensor histidine kinase
MVLNELLLNAVEHGFAGREESELGEVVISAHRFRRQLHVTVADNGRGLPDGFTIGSADRLGLQIVRTLANEDLRGSIEMRPRSGGGTEAVLVVPLGRR